MSNRTARERRRCGRSARQLERFLELDAWPEPALACRDGRLCAIECRSRDGLYGSRSGGPRRPLCGRSDGLTRSGEVTRHRFGGCRCRRARVGLSTFTSRNLVVLIERTLVGDLRDASSCKKMSSRRGRRFSFSRSHLDILVVDGKLVAFSDSLVQVPRPETVYRSISREFSTNSNG